MACVAPRLEAFAAANEALRGPGAEHRRQLHLLLEHFEELVGAEHKAEGAVVAPWPVKRLPIRRQPCAKEQRERAHPLQVERA